ncbi:MAG: isoprenyl transferase [Candidatus Schekmanbacteria bacterium]|nr:isoprenyl transferase [Candidatus Schekmanbacteria bacterium]
MFFNNKISDRKIQLPQVMERLAALDKSKLPQHIAIIMDGNGRWARRKKLPRIAGHHEGIQSVHDVVELITDHIPEIKVLTLYAFSTENWGRPAEEVSALMKFLVKFLRQELYLMERNKIRYQTIGHIEKLPEIVQQEIAYAKERTKDNQGMILNIALNYSSKVEIVDAARLIAADVFAGKLNPEQIDEQVFSAYLYTAPLPVPNPDLLIRTSGELRISNFLLWQLAYAEIWITPVLWPDFREMELLEALADYTKRERRFGKVGEKL